MTQTRMARLALTVVAMVTVAACGPSEHEQALAAQVEDQAAEIQKLRSALEEAQSNVRAANDAISEVQVASLGSCAELRDAADNLEEIAEVEVPPN